MIIKPRHPPREFEVGINQKITLKDCGSIHLEPNEQITFATAGGHEYDVVRKTWGFYATPSLNGRLEKFNLRAVLVKNRADFFFLLLVEKGKEPEFQKYADSEHLSIVCWMDNAVGLRALGQRVAPD